MVPPDSSSASYIHDPAEPGHALPRSAFFRLFHHPGPVSRNIRRYDRFTAVYRECFFISHIKYGAPIRAVMTPTGSSPGARIVLAIVSHITIYAAPAAKEAGTSRL